MERHPLTPRGGVGFCSLGPLFCFCVPVGEARVMALYRLRPLYQDMKDAALRGLVTLLGPGHIIGIEILTVEI